jgi:predicted permease
MEKDIKKKAVIPFLACLGFIAVSVNSIYRGIIHHETWRIIVASAGCAVFVGFVILIICQVIKDKELEA